MNENNTPHTSSRRRALLAGVAVLGLGGLLVGEQVMTAAGPALAQEAVVAPEAVAPEVQAQAFPSFADVVDQVQPAVVSIRVRTVAPETSSFEGPEGRSLEEFFRRFGAPEGFEDRGDRGDGEDRFTMGQGSGFFISADGYVVTNNHVVENAEEVEVTLDDGTTYPATVIGTDPKTDLALVKVDADRDFAFVEFSDAAPRVGEWVMAVGNPFGLGGSVTAGIISARGRDIGAGPYDDFLQIDASINRGNSGGPAFNLEGDVVGVNTAIYSPSGGSVGIGFAIPAETVQRVVADLKEDGIVTRGWLGVQIQPVSDDIAESLGLDHAYGALVTEPQGESPAAAAGIEAGDVVLSVQGAEVEDARDLARRIAGYAPDTTVEIAVWRDGETRTFNVQLGTLPGEEELASLSGGNNDEPASLEDFGLTIAPAASVGAGEEGVVITELDPRGAGAEQGLQEGDVILEVSGEPVNGAGDIRDQIQAAEEAGRKAILMRVLTDDQIRFVALPLDLA